MTEDQYRIHKDQVNNARLHFNQFWEVELPRYANYGNADKIRLQVVAWRAWLAALNLSDDK